MVAPLVGDIRGDELGTDDIELWDETEILDDSCDWEGEFECWWWWWLEAADDDEVRELRVEEPPDEEELSDD